MITLSSFRPELFNRNADQGNMLVLAKQLQWRGVESQQTLEFDPSADFLIIGDAFNAVMREYAAELLELAPTLQQRLDAGMPTLLVGSSYEFFIGVLDGIPTPKRGQRVSEFREARSNSLSAFGYRNTDLEGDDLFVKGSFIATTLFGPVLAKSPELLQAILRGLGVQSELSPALSARLGEYLEKIRTTSIAG